MPLLRPSCPASEGKRSRRERARSGETAHAALKPCRLMLKLEISVCFQEVVGTRSGCSTRSNIAAVIKVSVIVSVAVVTAVVVSV